MLKSLLLTAVVSASTGEDVPPVVEVVSGRIHTTVDEREVAGGCYLPAQTCVAKATELRELRVENAVLKAEPESGHVVGLAVVAFLVGVIAGAAAAVRFAK